MPASPQYTSETCLKRSHTNTSINRNLNNFLDREHTRLRFYGNEKPVTRSYEAASIPIYLANGTPKLRSPH
jgi:hypothetical protein